jgi:pilus assembly protein Flp/PilA
MDLLVVRTWFEARFGRDERGANLIEYLLLLGLVAIAVMGAVVFLGTQLSPKYNQAGSQLSRAPNP